MIAVTAEPKMEDLLASIRRAIHDDIGDVTSSSQSQGALFKGAMRELRVKRGDEASTAREEIRGVRDRTRAGEFEAVGLRRLPGLSSGETDTPRRISAPSRVSTPGTAFWDDEGVAESFPAGRGMLSPEAEITAGKAFNTLIRTMGERPGGGQPIEDMTKDLLRGLLKQWLNANLPSLVERLVREEIERVARRDR